MSQLENFTVTWFAICLGVNGLLCYRKLDGAAVIPWKQTTCLSGAIVCADIFRIAVISERS